MAAYGTFTRTLFSGMIVHKMSSLLISIYIELKRITTTDTTSTTQIPAHIPAHQRLTAPDSYPEAGSTQVTTEFWYTLPLHLSPLLAETVT